MMLDATVEKLDKWELKAGKAASAVPVEHCSRRGLRKMASAK
jgi:hypothetical protein